MASLLHKRQVQFTKMLPRLIDKAYELGYEVTLGWGWRPTEIAERYGKPNSCHIKRLAVDLCLFKNGKYLTKTPDYELLGKWWDGIGGAWGGDWGDGNHFSLSWEGHK